MKTEQNNKLKKVLILVGVILIISVIGVFSYNFIKESKENSEENIQNQIDEKENQTYEEFEISGDATKLEFIDVSGDFKDKKQEEKIKGLKLSKFKLTKQEDSITIDGSIENTTNETIENVELLYRLYDSTGKEVHNYNMIISEKVEAGEIRTIETNIGLDGDNISDISVEIIESAI